MQKRVFLFASLVLCMTMQAMDDEQLYENLWNAVKCADVAAIEFFLNNGGDVTVTDWNKSSLLHQVTTAAGAEVLIKNGAQLDVHDICGYSPLYKAVERNNPSLVECLLKHGANVHWVNKMLWSLLHYIDHYYGCNGQQSENSYLAIVDSLVKYGADINSINERGDTPLLKTVRNPGKNALVEKLLLHGAHVHAPNQLWETPLSVAANQYGDKDHLKLLQAVADKQGAPQAELSPFLQLKRIVSYSDAEEVSKQALVDLMKQCSANQQGYVITTVLDRGNKELIKLLFTHILNAQNPIAALEHLLLHPEVKINEKVNQQLVTLLQTDDEQGVVVSSKIFDHLIIQGFDVNAKADGEFPLITSYVMRDKIEVVRKLLSHGARTDIVGPGFVYPLHKARSEAMVHLLIQNGRAKVAVGDSQERTPLHKAAQCGFLPVLNALIQYKAMINARSLFGETALHEAIENKRVEIAQVLITRGADCAIKNNAGLLPIDMTDDTSVKQQIYDDWIEQRKREKQ